MQLFSKDATMFLRKIHHLFFSPENHPQKLLIIGPDPFLSVLSIDPNLAQISIPVPQKSPTAGLPYNDFVYSI